MTRDKVRRAVENLLQKAPFSMRDLADAAGVSYGALRGWAIGRRVPDPENRARLVQALREKSTELSDLAGELEKVDRAGEG